MKREDFIKIIKLRSIWKVDKRKGNYTLPSGEHLRIYIEKLVNSQLELDHLGIAKNGNLCDMHPLNEDLFGDYELMTAFANNEICSYDEQEKRIEQLVREII